MVTGPCERKEEKQPKLICHVRPIKNILLHEFIPEKKGMKVPSLWFLGSLICSASTQAEGTVVIACIHISEFSFSIRLVNRKIV